MFLWPPEMFLFISPVAGWYVNSSDFDVSFIELEENDLFSLKIPLNSQYNPSYRISNSVIIIIIIRNSSSSSV